MCVDRLRATPRRPLPRDLREPGLEIGAPLVPALDVPRLMPAPSGWSGASDPERAAEERQGVRLAVTAMRQRLPARQRGVLVLRDVLGYSAAETAAVLELTVRLLVFPIAVGEGGRLFAEPRSVALRSSEQVGPATLSVYSAST